MTPISVIVAILVALVCLAAGIVAGITIRKNTAEKEIGSAEEEATRIVNVAIKEAESKKREALVEAREEIHQERNAYEREVKEQRSELQKQERRLQSKEENLDRKIDQIEKKEERLQSKLAAAERTREEAEAFKRSQMEVLERISGLTTEEAKRYLIEQVEADVTHEEAVKIKEVKSKFKEEADSYARELIALAIQRCAADQVAEVAVSVVPLPNDEIKGRIIGREGRNIRTLETLTGAELIIDDTPEAITISCFDPVRREITRIALERLIADGRIHPARIEEMVEKAKREVEATIKAEGERAVFETNIHSLHPELIRLLGRMHYRTSYGQNVLNHCIEVSHIAGLLASEIGADVAQAKRAGLLHDIGKSVDHEIEGSHVQIGVELAKRYKESDQVVHAIAAHHNDVEPQTIVACLVQAADAISAARPGARRENVENYIKRLEKLEEISSSFKGVDKAYAIQAGREIRIMVKPEEVSEDEMVILARDIAKQIEESVEYPGQIKVHLIRETKAIEYAK
ncbi:MAG TPA: ribonuclease Y [Candidatus Onthomonas avicola]|nr:ribonuclease Y [Candidatus Onthomonas avicola]